MEFVLLAIDYDGTLAHEGIVDSRTIAALERLRISGRKLVLVTGRHLPDLRSIFPRLDLFDRIVVENGGVLYEPQSGNEKPLCKQPNPKFVSLLNQKKVPFSLGKTVVATWSPYDEAVLIAIRELGLDLQVSFNKGAVMVLPAGVNKGSGLKSALDELGIATHNVVSIGDAENDLAFLRISGCSVAVSNALASVKEEADLVLPEARGGGVIALIEKLLADDLNEIAANLKRHSISLGNSVQDENREVRVSPRSGSILIAGPSGSGKSTTVAGILEQLIESEFQFCLIDPEGDYEGFPGTLSFGGTKEPAELQSVFRALESSQQSVVVDLLGISVDDRPGFFASLLPRLQELRSRTARPHWLVVDEAHHMLPTSWSRPNTVAQPLFEKMLLITVHPEHVAKAALDTVEVVLAIGKPSQVFRSFSEALQIHSPSCGQNDLAVGEAMVWFRKGSNACVHVKTVQTTKERRRHLRNYAEGELSPEQSFYFRGPEGKLDLRAQNLKLFLQLADGVDEETWLYHLQRGDYSAWFESVIKDPELAREAAEVERNTATTVQDSRKHMREIVERRYTAPA